MTAGTSPSITALAGGGFEIAFQANTGALWTYGTASSGATDLGVNPRTSPSIAGAPSGGYEAAFQAYVPPSGGGSTTTPSPPVVSTPVPISVPSAPVRGVGHRRRLKVKITLTWTWDHARSRLHRIRLTGLPKGAKLTITCRGRGCPRRRLEASGRSLKRLQASSLSGRVYRAGDRVFITVTAPGYEAERAEFVIRYGALPTVRRLGG
jgi:hypothetical protein